MRIEKTAATVFVNGGNYLLHPNKPILVPMATWAIGYSFPNIRNLKYLAVELYSTSSVTNPNTEVFVVKQPIPGVIMDTIELYQPHETLMQENVYYYVNEMAIDSSSPLTQGVIVDFI